MITNFRNTNIYGNLVKKKLEKTECKPKSKDKKSAKITKTSQINEKQRIKKCRKTPHN